MQKASRVRLPPDRRRRARGSTALADRASSCASHAKRTAAPGRQSCHSRRRLPDAGRGCGREWPPRKIFRSRDLAEPGQVLCFYDPRRARPPPFAPSPAGRGGQRLAPACGLFGRGPPRPCGGPLGRFRAASIHRLKLPLWRVYKPKVSQHGAPGAGVTRPPRVRALICREQHRRRL
jgi:hypothetical protein